MDLQPYVVEQGDYMLAIAGKYGFDPDQVWQLPDNKPLRDKGRDPAILFEGDIVYIPMKKGPWLPVTAGASNTFSATPLTVPVSIVLCDNGAPLKGESCIVHLPKPLTQKTDVNGVLKLVVPISLKEVRVEIPRLCVSLTCRVGYLDPLATPSGIRQRLANLGHGLAHAEALNDDDAFAAAVASFQTAAGIDPTGTMCDATSAALEKSHGT